MTRPTIVAGTLRSYLERLVLQLRLRDVPGSRIGQITAEVESHVLETGQDPVEAFGEPGAYAAEYADGYAVPDASERETRASRRSRIVQFILVAVLVLGLSLVVAGLPHLVGTVSVDVRTVLLWLASAALCVGMAHVVMTALGRGSRSQAGNPYLLAYAAAGVGLFVLMLGSALTTLLLPSGAVLLTLPGWLIAAVGAVVVGVLARRHLEGDLVVDPRPSGTSTAR